MKTTKDDKLDVPVDIDQDTLYALMFQAHKEDITLNQLVENILKKAINEQQKITGNR